MNYILWIIAVAMMVSCAKDDQKNSDVVMESKMGTTFLSIDEVPILKLTIINEEAMLLRIMNQYDQFQELQLENSPGEYPSIDDYFYTKFCNQNVLVVMISQSVNTGVSYGHFYWNVVINLKDGALIKVIEEGEVKEKETDEIISDGQKETLAELKSSQQAVAMCKPN